MVPQLPATTLAAFLKDGYTFISRRCEHLGSDGFRVNLVKIPVTFMRGPEAVGIFYGTEHVTRAIPWFIEHLLQDKGSVQSLDGAAHRHRKAMFMALLHGTAERDVAGIFAEEWQRGLQAWSGRERIELHHEAQLVLTRTALRWSGIPPEGTDVRRRAKELSSMVDWIALLGPPNWTARAMRLRTERWAAGLIEGVRAGSLTPPAGSALEVIAHHRDPDGRELDSGIAGVELINVLRPMVAVSRFVAFAATALIERPEWAKTFGGGDETDLDAFVNEVRRYYPFFPAVPGRVVEPFTWQGEEIAAGGFAVVDLYGTNHHPEVWDRPEVFDPARFRGWSGDPDTLVPQGGGKAATGHRCPGESVTISLMKETVRQLTQHTAIEVPVQDLSIRLNHFPALPREGVLLKVRPA